MSNYEAFLRNPKSGEVHRVAMCDTGKAGYKRFSMEVCNLDSCEDLEELESETVAVATVGSGGSWCGWCNGDREHTTITFPGDAGETASD